MGHYFLEPHSMYVSNCDNTALAIWVSKTIINFKNKHSTNVHNICQGGIYPNVHCYTWMYDSSSLLSAPCKITNVLATRIALIDKAV
mgnify:CR=1 FL=1